MTVIRKLLFVAIFLASTFDLKAQCSDWDILLAYENVYVRAFDRDRFGNLYVTGYSYSSNFKIGNTTIPIQGAYDMFILKFNKQMSLVWSRVIAGGTTSGISPWSLLVDKEDNIVISGYFATPTVNFDCFQLTKNGRSEIFLVKYSRDGYAEWAQATSGLTEGWKMNLVITKSNTIILSCSFVSGPSVFGGITFNGFGGYDSFIASVAPSGTVNWVRDIGGPNSVSYDYIHDIDVDSDGNIAITGLFGSPMIKIGDIKINGLTMSENYFVAKLDKSGNILWARGGETPIDQSGFVVVMDNDKNVIVAGRFYTDDITFGNLTLPYHQGDYNTTDIFVLKYDSDGILLNGRSIGGAKSDSPYSMALDKNGDVVLGASYYSNILAIDGFTATKDEPSSDLFIATFDQDLSAKCFNRVFGSKESFLYGLSVDGSNNIWVLIENNFAENETIFDEKYHLNNPYLNSLLVSIGGNHSFELETATGNNFSFSLGKDIIKCRNDEVQLDAGQWCTATYYWSNGSQEQSIKTKDEGLYWVDVSMKGKVTRDSILVTNTPDLIDRLGSEGSICSGSTVELDATQSAEVLYQWENGSTLAKRNIQAPGKYRVQIIGACETIFDEIVFTQPAPIVMDLGPDKIICSGSELVLSVQQQDDVSYKWQDGNESPELVVTNSGSFRIQATNECEILTDEVTVTIFNDNQIKIPNVITPNGDSLNETLILPELLKGASLKIVNRWGQSIYESSAYENNWPAYEIDSGVYFITIHGTCLESPYKGSLHVIRY